MRRALTLTLLAACGASPTLGSSPAPMGSMTPAPPSASASASPVAVTIPKPPASAAPPAEACAISQDEWTSLSPRVLRTPSGAVFADVVAADRLVLTTTQGPALETRVFGVKLDTVPAEGDIPVYLKTARAFAGILTAGTGTPLRWKASGDGVLVTLPPDARIRFENGVSVSQEVSCKQLGLLAMPTHGASQDQTIARGGNAIAGGGNAIAGPRQLAVSATAGGPTVARVSLPGRTRVLLQERSGTQAKIAWYLEGGPLDDALVIGWVDAAVLQPTALASAEGRPATGSGMAGTSEWFGCTKDQPLFADVGRGPEPVGTLLQGTQVRTLGASGAMKSVQINGPSVRPVPSPLRLRGGARFVVPEDVAKDCGGT